MNCFHCDAVRSWHQRTMGLGPYPARYYISADGVGDGDPGPCTCACHDVWRIWRRLVP